VVISKHVFFETDDYMSLPKRFPSRVGWEGLALFLAEIFRLSLPFLFFPPSKQFSSYILNWSYQATPFSLAESGRCWQRAEGAEPFPGEKRIAATFQRCVFISDFISRFFDM